MVEFFPSNVQLHRCRHRMDLNIVETEFEQFWLFHVNTGKQDGDKAVEDVY